MSSRREPSRAKNSRNTWRQVGSRRELGAGTDQRAVANPHGIAKLKIDPRRLNTTGESQRSSDRGALVSYFRDIAEIPTLTKEDEVLLAKEIEAATLAFREGMVHVPWTAKEAVRIWQGLKAENRATGKMCESFGSGSPEGEDLGARIDLILGKIEALWRKRETALVADKSDVVGKLERRMARLLKDADLSMQLLARMRREVLDYRKQVARGTRRIASLQSPRRATRTANGRKKRAAELAKWRTSQAELEREEIGRASCRERV